MRKSLALGLVLALGFAAGQVFSKDDPNRSFEDMKKAIEQNATPGSEHNRLKPLEGSFETHARATFDPAQPPKEASGKAEQKIIFGGLFLKEDFEGQCPITGKTIHGIGYTGFDKAKGKYVSAWLDSGGSGIMLSEGTADPAGKVITFHGMCTDPMTGKESKVRSVLNIVDDHKYVFEMYRMGPDGKEFRALEVTYNKK
jgi:hypothetical protein